MHTLTEEQILQIMTWRERTAQACLTCEKEIEALNIQPEIPMSVGQAKRIVAWDIRFMRIKIQMSELHGKWSSTPADFPLASFNAFEEAKQAITHGRKNIVGNHLKRAIGVLQRAGSSDKKSTSKFAESWMRCVSESEGSESAQEAYRQQLYDKAIQKKQRAELGWQRLRAHLQKIRESKYRRTTEHKVQETVTRLNMRFKSIDQVVLAHARSNIKSKYENIKNNHDALDVWLSIVKEAYEIANNNIDLFLDKVEADIKRRKHIKTDIMKGFVSLAMSPFLLNYFVDPTLFMLSGLAKKVTTLANSLAEASTSPASNGSVMSEIQRQFYSFLGAIGIAGDNHEKTIKKIDEMRENSPVEFVDLMKQFSDYKLHGFAKDMSQAFDSNSQIWNGHTPEEVICAQRMKLIREAQMDLNEAEWKKVQDDKFEHFFHNIEMDLKKQFDTVSRNIFSEIDKQYPKRNDIIQLQNIINALSFDEKVAGMNAVRTKNRNELIKAMADQIETSMIVKYACTYDGFFGGSAKQAHSHINLMAQQRFDPYQHSHFGLKADQQGRAIIDHLIKKLPNKKGELETLKNVGIIEATRCHWNLKTSEKQSNRQSVLNEIIQEYANGDISTKLKSEVFKFAAAKNIDIPTRVKPTVKHEWIAEKALRDHAEKSLAPLIQEADKYRTVTQRQLRLTKELLDEKALIKSVPSSLDDQTMQRVTDSRSLFEI
ncbi:MAG: hypothetical protein ACHQAX_07650 [Gammaproteobacteria bacterium]